jgi:hypothetical protein
MMMTHVDEVVRVRRLLLVELAGAVIARELADSARAAAAAELVAYQLPPALLRPHHHLAPQHLHHHHGQYRPTSSPHSLSKLYSA